MLSKSKALLSRNARHLRPKRQNRGVLLVFTIIFTVYSIVLLFPFIWLFINSFKDGIKEFTDNPWGLPQSWKFENYAMIFQMENFNVLEMFGNTLILSIAVPTASCLSTTLAAYVMAKFKFKGHGILYAVYLIPMLVAITGTTSSLYMLIDSWGLIGSFTGIIIMAASGTGMNFLLVYSLFKNVDNAYMEAARIDGANEFRIGTVRGNIRMDEYSLEGCMYNVKEWPGERKEERDGITEYMWHHSDFKQLAYFFVHRLFDKFVQGKTE